jgi:hypothetical protein
MKKFIIFLIIYITFIILGFYIGIAYFSNIEESSKDINFNNFENGLDINNLVPDSIIFLNEENSFKKKCKGCDESNKKVFEPDFSNDKNKEIKETKLEHIEVDNSY